MRLTNSGGGLVGGRAPGSTPAFQRQLRRKHQEQDGLCFYCEQPAWLPALKGPHPFSEEYASNRRRAKTRATREHLVRRADGGTDDDSNIVMACARCNHERQDTPVDVYKQMIMARPTSINCS
jgi:5-methylcytosine-specific restriction endonuclease McrA